VNINILWRDVITLALAGFAAIVIILLSHINPPKQQVGEAKAPGNVVVEAKWPDGKDIDVDLWVQAPGDIPVGYSNLNGVAFNLLRDDLGNQADILSLNYETAYTRGIFPGEYIVNVHLYRNGINEYPVVTTVVVSRRPEGMKMEQLFVSKVALKFVGQEITVVRFGLDRDGALIPGSIHYSYKELRPFEVYR